VVRSKEEKTTMKTDEAAKRYESFFLTMEAVKASKVAMEEAKAEVAQRLPVDAQQLEDAILEIEVTDVGINADDYRDLNQQLQSILVSFGLEKSSDAVDFAYMVHALFHAEMEQVKRERGMY
jgi:hypothetical protein